MRRVFDRVQVVQIDSVNVVSRSHYLPFFSRLGAYDHGVLDGLRDRPRTSVRPRPGGLVEYWAHEASLIPAATWPMLAFRMRSPRWLDAEAALQTQHPGLLEAVTEVVRGSAGMTSREVEAALPTASSQRRGQWGWNWSAVKECLEHLFMVGTLTSAGRTAQFERRYAAVEDILTPELMTLAPGRPGALTDGECAEELVRRSARALGVGTQVCLRDYFRLPPALARAAIARLVQAGELEEVSITGWDRPAYLDPQARRPRRSMGTALLSPFDSLIWQRQRTEELFGFRYRLEIYTPKERRVYGYYVLPYLLDGELVARVDVKADRSQKTLRVLAISYESGAPKHAAHSLVVSLTDMSNWLGLESVALP